MRVPQWTADHKHASTASTLSAKALLGAPHCPQALHAPMPPPDLDYAAEWCAESDFGTYSASALCCVLCKKIMCRRMECASQSSLEGIDLLSSWEITIWLGFPRPSHNRPDSGGRSWGPQLQGKRKCSSSLLTAHALLITKLGTCIICLRSS